MAISQSHKMHQFELLTWRWDQMIIFPCHRYVGMNNARFQEPLLLMVYFDFLFLFDFSPLSSCSKLASFTLLSSALNSAPKFSRTENPCWPDNQSDILPTWSDIPKSVVGIDHVRSWASLPWQRSQDDDPSPCVSKSCKFLSFRSGSYFPPAT